MQDRKFDRGLIDNKVLRKLCSEKTEPKSALKKVESDLVEPNNDLARGPHSEGATEACCDVRSTFVAEVTYKQVVFPRGAEAGQAGQGEREGGGDQGGGEEVQGGGEGGGGEEVIPGEEILSEREKAEQVRCVRLIFNFLFLLLADGN